MLCLKVALDIVLLYHANSFQTDDTQRLTAIMLDEVVCLPVGVEAAILTANLVHFLLGGVLVAMFLYKG